MFYGFLKLLVIILTVDVCLYVVVTATLSLERFLLNKLKLFNQTKYLNCQYHYQMQVDGQFNRYTTSLYEADRYWTIVFSPNVGTLCIGGKHKKQSVYITVFHFHRLLKNKHFIFTKQSNPVCKLSRKNRIGLPLQLIENQLKMLFICDLFRLSSVGCISSNKYLSDIKGSEYEGFGVATRTILNHEF